MLSKQELLEEEFRRGLAHLVELSGSGVVVVVEGLKDVAALQRLGLSGLIITLSGQSVVDVADKLAEYERVLVLFDFDRRGEQLARQLVRQLRGRGVVLLGEVRRRLRRAFSWQSRVIEGLKPLEGVSGRRRESSHHNLLRGRSGRRDV